MTRFLRKAGAFWSWSDLAHTKRLIRLLSVCWFILYCGFLLFEVVFWGGTPLSLVELFIFKPLVSIPAICLVFGFCTSFAKRRSPMLLAAGIFIHILLAVFLLRYAGHDILGPVFVLTGGCFAVIRFWMYSRLETRHVSSREGKGIQQ